MNEQQHTDLLNTLAACASELQTACIVKTGVIQLPSVPTDQMEWMSPCLHPRLSLGGVDLNVLPKLLYGGEPHPWGEARAIWNECVSDLFAKRDARPLIENIFPDISFVKGRCSPATPLIQLLCVLGWGHGTFKATATAATLTHGIDTLQIDARMVTHNGKRVRLPRQCPVTPDAALSRPIGRHRRASAKTTGLYRYLVRTLPHLAPHLDVVFSTAVAVGRDGESELTTLFDVVSVPEAEVERGVWDQARRLVRESTTTPNAALWALLKGTMSYHAFTKLLGNPSRGKGSLYSSLLRKRHLAALDRAEGGEVNLTVTRLTGDQAEASAKLLQLQRMMGAPR